MHASLEHREALRAAWEAGYYWGYVSGNRASAIVDRDDSCD